jgi:DNA-binding PadR family transcriptional regulator
MKNRENTNIIKRMMRGFMDLAILCRLEQRPMTGYRISVILVHEFGVNISPDTIYHAIYKLERKGLIKCIREKPGRVYTLTQRGKEITQTITYSINESQKIIKQLLCGREQ